MIFLGGPALLVRGASPEVVPPNQTWVTSDQDLAAELRQDRLEAREVRHLV